jgi:hypothetical protein
VKRESDSVIDMSRSGPKQSRRAINPPGGFCLNARPRMPSRLQKYFWRSLDHAMPDGAPIFLVVVIVCLLVVNSFVAFFPW